MFTSGSLTGHILSQGHPVPPGDEKSRTRKLVIVLGLLGFVVIVAVFAAVAAGRVAAQMFGG
jgi:hypothetical protein